jgi:hypothetical protein
MKSNKLKNLNLKGKKLDPSIDNTFFVEDIYKYQHLRKRNNKNRENNKNGASESRVS